jgi:hypothetical protein
MVVPACLLSEDGWAQEKNRFALGADVTIRASTNGALQPAAGTGLVWRFGHDKSGWGWHWGWGWYSLDTNRPVDGRLIELGEAHIRPLMIGYGYTHVAGRVSIRGDMVAGYSLNNFTVGQSGHDAYLRAGGDGVSVKLSNEPVVRPEVGMWLDVLPSVGLNLSAGYTIVRPTLTITSGRGREIERTRADALGISLGVVYRIF